METLLTRRLLKIHFHMASKWMESSRNTECVLQDLLLQIPISTFSLSSYYFTSYWTGAENDGRDSRAMVSLAPPASRLVKVMRFRGSRSPAARGVWSVWPQRQRGQRRMTPGLDIREVVSDLGLTTHTLTVDEASDGV